MINSTIFYPKGVYIEAVSSIVGPKEGLGPLARYFDKVVQDDLLGQKSHELAECKMHILALKHLLNKAHIPGERVGVAFGGDLTDEIYGTNFAMREFGFPFVGVYNACATFGAAVLAGSAMVDGGYRSLVICSASSHFSSAERQYRFPLELGNQRTPLSQWTVTGCGAALLSNNKSKVRVECATIGRVVDFGVRDANNMGAAMAPAAADTLVSHFSSTHRTPKDYDLIVTGDLAEGGGILFRQLAKDAGYPLDTDKHKDCGAMIYNRMAQKVEQGGSGAGCVSAVFCSYLFSLLDEGKIGRLLLLPTGALISKTSCLQGQTIPCIAHAISFVAE